jgi:hypothetical protein
MPWSCQHKLNLNGHPVHLKSRALFNSPRGFFCLSTSSLPIAIFNPCHEAHLHAASDVQKTKIGHGPNGKEKPAICVGVWRPRQRSVRSILRDLNSPEGQPSRRCPPDRSGTCGAGKVQSGTGFEASCCASFQMPCWRRGECMSVVKHMVSSERAGSGSRRRADFPARDHASDAARLSLNSVTHLMSWQERELPWQRRRSRADGL